VATARSATGSAVTLGSNDVPNTTVVLTGTTVTFDATVNAAAKGTQALTVTGDAVFKDTVGVTKELGALSVTGTTTFNSGATDVRTEQQRWHGQPDLWWGAHAQ
jgi:hypothetical protein